MRYLLYCIFRSSEIQPPEHILGIDGQAVYHLSQNGLDCVISRHIPETFSSLQNPSINYLLAYEQVIEAYHQAQTVVPLRYGCFFFKETQVLQFLDTHGAEYQTLLQKIDGQVEIGVRMLIPENTPSPQPPLKTGSLPEGNRRYPGKEYLETRRKRYLEKEQLLSKHRSAVDTICRPLAGLFTDCRHEFSSINGSNILSIYFLVPRNLTDDFRQTLRRINSGKSVPLLFSGPWPPYNFVLPEQNSPYGKISPFP